MIAPFFKPVSSYTVPSKVIFPSSSVTKVTNAVFPSSKAFSSNPEMSVSK